MRIFQAQYSIEQKSLHIRIIMVYDLGVPNFKLLMIEHPENKYDVPLNLTIVNMLV